MTEKKLTLVSSVQLERLGEQADTWYDEFGKTAFGGYPASLVKTIAIEFELNKKGLTTITTMADYPK